MEKMYSSRCTKKGKIILGRGCDKKKEAGNKQGVKKSPDPFKR